MYGYGWTGNRKETRGRTSRLRMKSSISIWKVWEMAPVIFQLALASVFALRIVLETWQHTQVKTRWTITLWVALQVILYLKLVSVRRNLLDADERGPHLISARQKSVGEVHSMPLHRHRCKQYHNRDRNRQHRFFMHIFPSWFFSYYNMPNLPTKLCGFFGEKTNF